MRFHQPAAPADGALLSALEGVSFFVGQVSAFNGDGSSGLAPVQPIGSRWSLSSGGVSTINGAWTADNNASRIQDLGDQDAFRLAGGTARDYIRYTLAGGPGITSCFVLLTRGAANEPLRLYIEGNAQARAALVAETAAGAYFYIERSDGGPLSGTQIVARRINSLRFGFRAAVGQGRFLAEPPVRPELRKIRAVRRGTFNNLAFRVPYSTPRLTLSMTLRNHPVREDAEFLRDLTASSAFHFWSGGDEYWTYGGPPEERSEWDDQLIERRMQVTEDSSGGGAFGGARTGGGFDGRVVIAETYDGV